MMSHNNIEKKDI